MPWQLEWFDVLGEYWVDDLGRTIPYYRQAFFTTPRQSGKTTILLSWSWERMLGWGRSQRLVWTAQTGKDGREKWIKELYPRIETAPIRAQVKALNRGMGNESMAAINGSFLDLVGSSDSAGHGGSLDGGVCDEIFADHDTRREQMLIPAMNTVADGQYLVCSTAGTLTSVVYNAKRRQGRRAVEDELDAGMAYLEFSKPDGVDINDEDAWWGYMPALGYTITPDVVRSGIADMEAMAEENPDFQGGAERAYGNIPSGHGGADLIPEQLWVAVRNTRQGPAGNLALGVDVDEDRTSGSIGIGDEKGRCELIEMHKSGIGQLASRANTIAAELGIVQFIDRRGPAAGIADDLEHLGEDDVGALDSLDVVAACESLYDDIADRKVRIHYHPDLDRSREGLVRKDVGDNFVWSRKSSENPVSPLYAITLALAGAQIEPPESFALVFSVDR